MKPTRQELVWALLWVSDVLKHVFYGHRPQALKAEWFRNGKYGPEGPGWKEIPGVRLGYEVLGAFGVTKENNVWAPEDMPKWEETKKLLKKLVKQ